MAEDMPANIYHYYTVDPSVDPYILRQVDGVWLLIDTETGEIEDEFDDEGEALETLADQFGA